MEKDLIYVFDKKTKKGNAFGEIQSNFNMSFVIDGTKDSFKVNVYSFNGEEIEPNTIVYHKRTSTWWTVSKDKVERNANEDGFWYLHNLQLDGAVELLNARDLTDCGFNEKTYNVYTFIDRLFKLSTFEYDLFISSNVPDNFKNKVVGFIKTFENYTLLSALREFLDAFNSCPKLTFSTTYNSTNDEYTIGSAFLDIIQKTGDRTYGAIDIDFFNDIRETKVLSKESFGTCVVSNAENVISSKEKIYPSLGAVRPSSNTFDILAQNGVIRLPSNVYKGVWLKLVGNDAPISIKVTLAQGNDGTISYASITQPGALLNPADNSAITYLLNQVRYFISAQGLTTVLNEYIVQEEAKRKLINEFILDSGTITLYNGNSINPVSKAIIKGENVPYLANVTFDAKMEGGNHPYGPLIFCDSETKQTLPKSYQGIQWERGKNVITGFDAFVPDTAQQGYVSFVSDLYYKNTLSFTIFNDGQGNSVVIEATPNVSVHFRNTSWIVCYIPMADIKIKVDNQRDKLDIQLYNQNGKLTDAIALSKLINSYSKEISSDKITRYYQAYLFSDVPKVGRIVMSGNDYYVINNVSMDFYQNETISANRFGYFIDCEITMCKYVSTKSMLTSPNTNIRDYGIPQYFNVKRKQLYRDYYELSYEYDGDSWLDTPYLPIEKVFVYPNKSTQIEDYIAIMELTYESQVEGSTQWYYQLNTTKYYLDKMLYIVLDFNDNNIIGYGSQNVYSGFDVTRIFDGSIDSINTPISYVDEYGEVNGIHVLLCNSQNIGDIYEEYQQAHKTDVATNVYNAWLGKGESLFNYSVFVPHEIYSKALNGKHEISIYEPNYKKDALEVPVFEYVCQIDDSDNVLIGDNILSTYNNCLYFYSYRLGGENDNFTQNNIVDNNSITATASPLGWRINNGVSITLSQQDTLFIRLYEYEQHSINDQSFTYGNNVNVTPNRDIAIFRHVLDLNTGKEIAEDLLFILKKVPSSAISTLYPNRITIVPNYYKLK